VVPELGRDDIRELIVGSYPVIYRRREDLVEIAAIRHHARHVDEDELTR
jgi:plasmid stabilization system protein ParE